jgi:hypothetical protein
MRKVVRFSALTAATAATLLLFAGVAGAQAVSCSSFATQQQAQAYYDQHKNDTPGNPDPAHLDADGDGKACEGLPSAPSAVATAAPIATTVPSIPKNGAETGVMALSGLSLLEAGYGMTLLARRYGVKRRNVPIYLLKKLVSAGKLGQAAVQLGDDIYLVHESALVATADDSSYRYVEVPEEERFELVYEDEPDEADDIIFAPPPTPAPRMSVYATLAKGAEIADEAPPAVIQHDVEPEPELWDDDFAWRV